MTLLHRRLDGENAHEAGLSLLKELCGGTLPEIRRTPLGKPYFPHSKLYFSISHTPLHAFCVISQKPVGIDAEELRREIDLRLAEKILSPTELSQYEKAEDKQRALLTFWVLKEAAGKCTGEGLQIWPNHTDFFLSDPRVTEIDGCLVAVIEQE